MTRMLQAELLKLRTTRTFIALTGAALGLSLLFAILATSLSEGLDETDVKEIFANVNGASLFILLLGAIGMAGEWRHRTITGTVLAAPQRVKLLAAKVISYAVAGALLSLLVNIAVIAVGTAILSGRGEPTIGFSDILEILALNLLIAAFLGAIGVTVGTMIRNSAGAIVLLLALQFILEPLLFGLATDVGRWGPTSILPSAILDIGFEDEDLPAQGAAIAAMLGWIAVLFAAAAATFKTRDLN